MSTASLISTPIRNMSTDIDYKDLVNRFIEENGDVPEIQFILNEPTAIEISEIQGGGLINYILRVQSQDGLHSVILKHGVGHARCVPDLKLSLARQICEYDSLKLMDKLLPGSVPKPYCHDSKNHIICMEDLQEMSLFGNDLRKGEINLITASNIGRTVAQMHKATSKEELTNQEWQELETLFSDRESTDTKIDVHTKRIFQEHDPYITLPESAVPVFRKYVSKLLSNQIDERIRETIEIQECFIHSGCHWMSLFTSDDRIALFDFEFAFLGIPEYHLAWHAVSYNICMLEAIIEYPARAKEILELSEAAFKTLVSSYCKWRQNPITEGRQENAKGLLDFPKFTLTCGNIMFLFAVVARGDRLISLTDKQKVHLISLGARLMLMHGDFKSLEDVTQFIFHSDEEEDPRS